MHGVMVVNGFLKSTKFDELYAILEKAAKLYGLSLSVQTNAEIITKVETLTPETCDFVLFWDKDVHLASLLEQQGLRVFNSAKSILRCDDKALTYLRLKNEKIPMPKTILAPKTFTNIGYTHTDFANQVAKELGLPLVLKECFGSFGQQVYLMETLEQLHAQIQALAGVPMLFQALIQESYGRDIRLNVVGDRVVASMMRFSTNGDFRSNLTLGGDMKPYTPTKEEEELAIRTTRCLGLDFGGVDVLFGANGPLVCEVNSNAHFKTTLACTGVNMAEEMMKYMMNQLKAVRV